MKKVLILLVIFMMIRWGYSQTTDRVMILTDEDGLPQNKIKNLLKDKTGYLWITTQSEIAKYDGYTFKKYPGLNGKEISTLFIDHTNHVWLGTHSGLYVLDRIKDRFRQVSLGDIRDITEAPGGIYFGTPDHIYKIEDQELITKYDHHFHGQLKKIVHYEDRFYVGLGRYQGLQAMDYSQGDLMLGMHLLDGKIITSLVGIEDTLWIGSSDGSLFMLDKDQLIPVGLANTYAIMDIEKHDATYWIGTDGNGAFVIDDGLEVRKQYYNYPNQPKTIGSNNVHTLLAMGNGDMWMGTYDAGITYISSKENQFDKLTDLWQINTNLDLHHTATGCYEDSDQNLWLGTPTGFITINTQDTTSASIDFNECMNYLQGSKVLSFYEDKNERIWVGTYDGGLGCFSKNLERKGVFFPFTNGVAREQNINFILPYGQDTLLVNSMYKGLGLFSARDGQFSKVPLSLPGHTLQDYQTQAVRVFHDTTYAYVFGGDLCQLDRVNKVLKPLFRPAKNVNDFILNPDGTFWLATRGAGLMHVRRDGTLIKTLDKQAGLPTDFLLRVEKDDDNDLWITSIFGLIRMDTTGNITSYDHRHGLPSKEFSPFVSTRLKNGKLLFGTVKGFVMAAQGKKGPVSTPPRVIISDITFQNKSIKDLAQEKYLSAPIEDTPPIELPFYRNSLTIHFFNDDYNLPKYNTFKYRLRNLETNWINLDENTQTTYTNLSPGTYFFEVNSTNKYSLPGEQATVLKITILPPWYLSTWAISGYALLIIAIFYGVFRFVLYKAHIKKELEFSAYQVKAVNELNEKKLRFFTNITHDFKTPLTLISAPLNQLSADPTLSDNARQKLALIKRNADRLYHLIIDVLDFREISYSHQMTLKVTKTDMDRFLKDIYSPFKSACEQQSISLHMTNLCKEAVFFDNEKVKRILWNILSNAIKYTSQKGRINIHCKIHHERNALCIAIEDTGKGIDKEELPHIFDRYYQAGHKATNGNGLGLSIVKGLVDAHRGTIDVTSSIDQGSKFTLFIPFRKADYTDEEIIQKPTGNYHFLPPQIPVHPTVAPEKKSKSYNLPVLLIVEDHLELNQFLVNLFEPEYKVLKSFNGKEAYDIALSKNPDIIISDVLMPGMDGYALCAKLKSNVNTSHIPVILLTANSSMDQQIEGMNQGADVYITKPFENEFLIASARSILENRDRLRARFQKLDQQGIEEDGLSPSDQKFIALLKKYIDKNIDQSSLSIVDLSREMNCSKSTLIRKVKALTGLTPMSFMRTYRLNIAYEMIVKKHVSVSEAAYNTGFSDPNYFTTCFKKQFGKNPSQVVSNPSSKPG